MQTIITNGLDFTNFDGFLPQNKIIYYLRFFTSGGAKYIKSNGEYRVYVPAENLDKLSVGFSSTFLTDKHVDLSRTLDRNDIDVFGCVIKSFLNKDGFIKHTGEKVEADLWVWGIVEIYPNKYNLFLKIIEEYAKIRQTEAQNDISKNLDGFCDVSCAYRSIGTPQPYIHAGETYDERIDDWQPHHIALVPSGRYNGSVIMNNNKELIFTQLMAQQTEKSLLDALHQEIEETNKKNGLMKSISNYFMNSKKNGCDTEDSMTTSQEDNKENKKNQEEETFDEDKEYEFFKKMMMRYEAEKNASTSQEDNKENKKNQEEEKTGSSFMNSKNPHFQKFANTTNEFKNSNAYDDSALFAVNVITKQ